MKTVLFTGFLGSGKTTLLLSLARFLTRTAGPTNIVVIENEIGEANVDGLLMAGSDYEVRDLTSGCICCTLSGQLAAALTEIKNDLDPEWLLVEATGIAHQAIADNILAALPGHRLESLVVVDAERWDELIEGLPMLIMTQVERADLILLNKTAALNPDDLARVEDDLEEINGRSPRLRVPDEPDRMDDIWSRLRDRFAA